MTVESDEAAAKLAEVESVVAKVKHRGSNCKTP